MITYVDALDESRRLRIVSQSGGRVTCKVYFIEGGRLLYNGKTNLPASMFSVGNSQNQYTGFYAE